MNKFRVADLPVRLAPTPRCPKCSSRQTLCAQDHYSTVAVCLKCEYTWNPRKKV